MTDVRATIAVTVGHELGTVVADGFVHPGPAEAAITQLVDDDDPDLTVADIDPADARARIGEAVQTGRITFPPMETSGSVRSSVLCRSSV